MSVMERLDICYDSIQCSTVSDGTHLVQERMMLDRDLQKDCSSCQSERIYITVLKYANKFIKTTKSQQIGKLFYFVFYLYYKGIKSKAFWFQVSVFYSMKKGRLPVYDSYHSSVLFVNFIFIKKIYIRMKMVVGAVLARGEWRTKEGSQKLICIFPTW